MSKGSVIRLLGRPKQKEDLNAGVTVLKYTLYDWLSGRQQVYLIFDEGERLSEWCLSEDEYIRERMCRTPAG